jgi:pyrimidine-nucleoside phosphorylase
VSFTLSHYTCPRMRAVDLIRRKRDGGALEARDIRAFVTGVTDGSWPDYQVSALLMAIVWRGMTTAEAAVLTDAMVHSGTRLDLSEWGQAVVDKHSTGGVGDKISIVLGPLAAACGVIVPMMSGRGLGHTGGTLDKLEAIPGFQTRLSADQIRAALGRTGCALVGQTDDIAPADRRLYALRDVTATVESIPLIAASILSKKIAEGARGLVLDVKVGRGAFMKTEADAGQLADRLIDIAESNGLATEALLTAMDAPLGRQVGNAPEVVESIETLKGRGPADVEALSIALTTRMVLLAGIDEAPDAAEARVRRALTSGQALERLRAIIEQQGGDPRVVDDYTRLPVGTAEQHLTASRSGVVRLIDAERVGLSAVALGAGRDRADAAVDPSAGIELLVREGEVVRAGDPLARLSAADQDRVAAATVMLDRAIEIGDAAPPAPAPLILRRLGRRLVTQE